MREFDLPSPSIGGMGHHLRRVSAKAVSYIQVNAPRFTGGVHPNAAALKAFFTACAQHVAAHAGKIVPLVAFTPAKTFSIAAGAGQAGLAVVLDGSTGAVSYTSSTPAKATVNAATGAVTPVATGTTTITVTVAADATHEAASASYVATIVA